MNEIENELSVLRKDIVLAGLAGGAAHFASAFSMLEIVYTLYNMKILKYSSKNPQLEKRDRLILSKGHGCLALYAVLAQCGFFSKQILYSFCKSTSILGGEPCFPDIPGIETASGSLGHGLSFGIGAALALKADNKNNRVFVILGDGECEEGSIWEGVMSAVQFKLDNLTVIIDCNHIQKMGFVSDIISISDWKTRWTSFGWQVEEVNGHNVLELEKILNQANQSNTPRVVIAHTIKGHGISFMENNPKWHWRMPNKKEMKLLISELHITEEELSYAKSIH